MSIAVLPRAQSRRRRRILGFLVSALLIFGLGSASFAEGGAPTLRVTLTPNARTVKTGDNVVYTVEFSCASTDANCDGAVLTVDVPRFANPDGAVNSEVAPVLAAATNTTGVVAPPTIAAPTRNSDGKVVYNLGTAPACTAGRATITVRPPRGLVPKGATIAPEAFFAASSATQASAKAPTTVDGSADLSILKSGPVVPPVKGVEVTYTLRASYTAAMDATGKHTGVPAVGHVNADDVVVYDVLPHLGDRGVGPAASNARGSQWQPRLAGPVAVADSDVPRDKVKIQYSTSENACRGEATAQGAARAAGPAGCVDDWTDSPASFGDVRAVRAEFANANLAPKASIQMFVPVAAPAGASGTAWNSVAMAGREKDGKWLLPIEPIKVGLETTVDLEVEKAIAERKPAYGVGDEVDFQVTVKNLGSGEATSVRDGARGGGEAGVEGTKVELRDHDGAVVATATTGADGSYSFNRVPSGTATGVKVEDRLPKGLTFVSADRPYDSAMGVWDVGTLAPGKSAEISIVARATGGGGLVNKAEIAAADQKDVDSTPGNGVASEDDAASATVTVKPAPKPTPSPSPSPSAEPTSPAPASPEPTSTSPTATLTSPEPSPSPMSSPTATMPTPTPRRLGSSTVPEFSLNAAFAGISSKSSVCGAPRPPPFHPSQTT